MNDDFQNGVADEEQTEQIKRDLEARFLRPSSSLKPHWLADWQMHVPEDHLQLASIVADTILPDNGRISQMHKICTSQSLQGPLQRSSYILLDWKVGYEATARQPKQLQRTYRLPAPPQ